jgi:DNA-binding CsgD family transcriptional regulator
MTDLSPQEVATLRSLSSGLTCKETAYAMGISYHTVKTYAEQVRKKFGVKNMCAAAVKAERAGLLVGVEV